MARPRNPISQALLSAALASGLALSLPAGATEVRTFGNVSYLTGGIGVQSREDMMPQRGQFNLRLLFADTSGSYLADIAVTVTDQGGNTVLEAVSEGPYLWARLPAGRYRVTASNTGDAQSRQVNVPRSGAADVSFFWAPPR